MLGYLVTGNVSADGTGAGTHTYQWDAEGRVKSVDSGWTATYTYNALNRLKTSVATAVSPGTVSHNQTYEFDRWGNADCNPASLACANRSFNTAKNQISDTGFVYDAAGNLIDDGDGVGTHTYQWDAEGRLLSVDGPIGTACTASNSTACMVYNAFGQQVEQAGSGFRWVFPYHTWGEKSAWFNGSAGAWQRYLIFVLGRETRVYGTNQRYYFHANHLGSATMVTNELGGPTGERMFYPWGDRWAEAGAWIPPEFAAFRDTVPGTADIYVTQFRHYLPGHFRWLSPDPIAGSIFNPQSLNRYAYVLNNPTNLIDPLGLDECTTITCVTVSASDADALWYMHWWLNRQPILPWSSWPPYPSGGTGGGGTPPPEDQDVSETWQETFACGQSATGLMSDLKGNMGQLADNPVGPFIAKFPAAPIQTGGNYDIYSGVFTFTDAGPIYFNRLNVTVTSQTANSWTFTTNPQQHYINGTVTFMASNAGNGNVHFAVTANGNFANRFSEAFRSIIKAGEDSTWGNLLKNVRSYCSSGGPK